MLPIGAVIWFCVLTFFLGIVIGLWWSDVKTVRLLNEFLVEEELLNEEEDDL